MKLDFIDRFSKKNTLKYQFSRKSVQWKSSCCMLVVAFRNFPNAPKDCRSDFFSFFSVLFLSVAKESVPDKCRSVYHLRVSSIVISCACKTNHDKFTRKLTTVRILRSSWHTNKYNVPTILEIYNFLYCTGHNSVH